MKEMIYKTKRLDPPEVLLDKKVGKYRILILNYGYHPCGYVGVPLDHPLAGVIYDDLGVLDIEVHGGLSFSAKGDGNIYPKNYWWYGWDYAHVGDYAGYDPILSIQLEGKKWTTKEIYQEALSVIEQLEDIVKNKKYSPKILCPYCNSEQPIKINHDLNILDSGCPDCGFGSSYDLTIEIICSNCRKVIYEQKTKVRDDCIE